MKAQTVEQTLTAALWMIENVGFCQGRFYQLNDDDVPTAFCAIGALQHVERADAILFEDAREELRKVVREMGYSSIPAFNDYSSHSDSKRKVIQAFRTAIQRAKEQGI